MNQIELKKLLNSYKKGKVTLPGVVSKIASLPFIDLETVKIDTHRSLRKGYPEVILGMNKSAATLAKILSILDRKKENIIITKLGNEKFTTLSCKFPSLKYFKEAGIAVLEKIRVEQRGRGKILIVTAGTSDIPVAEEAYVTCKYMGNRVEKVYDVGVAGIHRLLDRIELVRKASVIVVVAGMEGALASVISGLTSKPVVAVPTSVGYGANFKGLSALLGMINSCSPGIAVVNIDNGFGAGYLASLINRR